MAREFMPNGQATLNSVVLIDLDNFNLKGDNGLQLKATLARKNGIPVDGMRSCEITADIYVTNETPQVKPLSNMLDAKREEIGLIVNSGDFEGLNCTASITWGPVTVVAKLGEGVVYNCTWKGSITELNM